MFKKLIKDYIYNQHFTLYCGNVEEVNNYLQKTYNLNKNDPVIPNDTNGYRVTLINKDNGIHANIVWIEKFDNTPSDYAILAHEIFHHVSRVMCDVNIEYIKDSGNEAFAYYLEMLFEQTVSFLQKTNKNNVKK